MPCFFHSPSSFQSTLPVWGATNHLPFEIKNTKISIHAPRVGSDEMDTRIILVPKISIHAPRVGSDGY